MQIREVKRSTQLAIKNEMVNVVASSDHAYCRKGHGKGMRNKNEATVGIKWGKVGGNISR